MVIYTIWWGRNTEHGTMYIYIYKKYIYIYMIFLSVEVIWDALRIWNGIETYLPSHLRSMRVFAQIHRWSTKRSISSLLPEGKVHIRGVSRTVIGEDTEKNKTGICWSNTLQRLQKSILKFLTHCVMFWTLPQRSGMEGNSAKVMGCTWYHQA